MKQLFLFFLCCCYLTLSAQMPSPPLLVPYLQAGEWGYSDTLGNIQLAPRYESAGFFERQRKEGGDYFARVETRWGYNWVDVTGELLLPKRYDLVLPLGQRTAKKTAFLVRKRGRLGVYDLEKGWLLPAKYDSLARLEQLDNSILLKRKDDPSYSRFNLLTKQLETTDITKVGYYLDRADYASKMVYMRQDGLPYLKKSDGWELVPAAVFERYFLIAGVMMEDQALDHDAEVATLPALKELGVDRVIDSHDYRRNSTARRYGFSQLVIVEKDGQMGVLKEDDSIYLPLAYDRVRFDANYRQLLLEKDGKVGLKVLFTHHPTIEPRYDTIRYAGALPVSDTWNFGLFEVTIDGQKAYVGESGVEYFE